MLGDGPEETDKDVLSARQAALPGALGGAGLTSMVQAADWTHLASCGSTLGILLTHLRPDEKYKDLVREIESVEESELAWAVSLRATYSRVEEELEEQAGEEGTPAA